jgi:hypothetical protein
MLSSVATTKLSALTARFLDPNQRNPWAEEERFERIVDCAWAPGRACIACNPWRFQQTGRMSKSRRAGGVTAGGRWWLGPLLLSAVACGSDKGISGGSTCGEGTVLAQGKCIPSCVPGTVLRAGQCTAGGSAGEAGEGGSAGSNDLDAGSAGENEAEGGSAGDDSAGTNQGGSNQGGTSQGGTSQGGTNQGGTSQGGTSQGGTNQGGSAGTNQGGSAGTNQGGSGGSGPLSPQRWFVFTQSQGVFAYDVTKFPSSSGLVSLKFPGRAMVWSPDGRRLASWGGGDVYCYDMQVTLPDAPSLLLTGAMGEDEAIPLLTWSADSKTLAVTATAVVPTGSNPNPPALLKVLDPAVPAPLIRTLSNNVTSVVWAPVGDRLLFTEGSVTHVLSVKSGVPGAELLLKGVGYSWSPDGKTLMAVSAGNITLTDVTQTVPAPVTISSPSVSAPTITHVAFSPDGAVLLYQGVQIREGATDVFRVALKPTIGTPVRVSTGLTGTASAALVSSSADGKWVIYNSSGTWAVDVSGATPGTPLQIAASPSNSASWLSTAPQKFLGVAASGLSLFDLSSPGASPLTVVSGQPNSSALNPSSNVVGYSTLANLNLRDLDHLENPAGNISVAGSATLGAWQWSGDGKFISLVEQTSASSLVRLVRPDGTTPSVAVALHTSSTTVPRFFWQP